MLTEFHARTNCKFTAEVPLAMDLELREKDGFNLVLIDVDHLSFVAESTRPNILHTQFHKRIVLFPEV